MRDTEDRVDQLRVRRSEIELASMSENFLATLKLLGLTALFESAGASA